MRPQSRRRIAKMNLERAPGSLSERVRCNIRFRSAPWRGRCASRAVNTMLLAHVVKFLWERFRLHFGSLFGYFCHPCCCKITKRTIQESTTKTRRTKTPKSDKSETPEASQEVIRSTLEPAHVATRSVHGCKGYPGIVPGLLRTPFSSILATKTIHWHNISNLIV